MQIKFAWFLKIFCINVVLYCMDDQEFYLFIYRQDIFTTNPASVYLYIFAAKNEVHDIGAPNQTANGHTGNEKEKKQP